MYGQQSENNAAAQVTLRSLQDRYRPLLVFAPHLTQDFRKQMAILAEGNVDLRERDAVTVPVVWRWREMGDGVLDGVDHRFLSSSEAASTRHRFHISPDEFTVILIGKDGSEKLRSHQPISLATLRATIDAMPMRQDEMRSNPKP